MNKYDILPNKRFFTKDIYKPHNLLDIIEVNKFIKKTLTVLAIVSIIILWFMAMTYSIQVTVFNH